MKIYVVGGGVAGVALTWHLLQRPGIEIELWDQNGIGKGTSGIAAGLLHPYVGKRAELSLHGHEAMQAAIELIDSAEKESGPICLKTGLFRPAITEQQVADFKRRSEEDPKTLWCEKKLAGVGAGLWIPEAVTVFSKSFLNGLWKACERRGARLIQEAWKGDSNGEIVVFATGAETVQFFPDLPLKINKGQLLVCRMPTSLPFALASEGHISPTQEPLICQVGSTYEHGVRDVTPDLSVAKNLIEKVAKFYPLAREFEILEVRAGWRIARVQGYLPFIEQVNKKTWVFTGFGSRGLLYAGFFARKIASILQ